jgi:nitrite reductase/ring-hydroxylating ferredoxin subunit
MCNTCEHPEHGQNASQVKAATIDLNRRRMLLIAAGALSAVGLTGVATRAEAAAKTYNACRTTDVRVGGMRAVTVGGKSLLITQPRRGTFRAFDATCTHEGCLVTQLVGTRLVCGCHGAKFDSNTGAAAGGPVVRGLTKIRVSVARNQVRVTF